MHWPLLHWPRRNGTPESFDLQAGTLRNGRSGFSRIPRPAGTNIVLRGPLKYECVMFLGPIEIE